MNRDEFERRKAEEKAHLRQVRALKQELRDAKRKKGLLDALKGLDTSALDATHEEMLRKVSEQNVTSEARFELAMEALDEAEKQEAMRQEMARIEAEQRKSDAADLVRQMKAQILGDAAQSEGAPSPADGSSGHASADPTPDKTIGASAPEPSAPTSQRPDPTPPSRPDADSSEPPSRTIGRVGPRRGGQESAGGRD